MLGQRMLHAASAASAPTGNGLNIPAGAIAPFVGASLPSGWSRYSLADNRFIVGAGGAYAAGSSGGNAGVSISVTSTTNGNHSGTNHGSGTIAVGAGAGSLFPAGGGNHSHSVTGTGIAVNVFRNYALIQATATVSVMPQDSLVLGVSDLSSFLTNTESAVNRFLRGSTFANIGFAAGSTTASIPCTGASAGNHAHGTTRGGNAGSSSNKHVMVSSGAQSHTVNMSGTLNTKRMYFSLWHKAAQSFNIGNGVILLWATGTPPAGWKLLDGTNGTVNARDFFMRVGTTANHGGVSGNNNTTLSGTLSAHSAHGHSSGLFPNNGITNKTPYSFSYTMATHTASQVKTILQRYHALSFITPI